jgi:5-methylcytosine-specific restriction endonuclease McrA
MHSESFYSTARWRALRAQALARDDDRCTVARLLGGACSNAPLHAHHIVALSEGGDPYDLSNIGTSCSAHHPMWESLRRAVVRQAVRDHPRCGHHHATEQARKLCEARLARRRGMVAA